MNKLMVVLGVAAVATLAGCKDPDYKHQGEEAAKPAAEVDTTEPTAPVQDAQPAETVPEKPKCQCPAGTVHAEACACGADDCQCKITPPPPPKPAEPETTVYIVQRGDYLAKISKKFNVTITSIKRINNLKNDNIRLGQKLRLPGKLDVGEQKVPEGAVKKPAPKAKPAAAPVKRGEPVEYVVKSGETLGGIAHRHGMKTAELKKLNGLEKDNLRVGQKLKVYAKTESVKPPEVKAPAVTDRPQTNEVSNAESPAAPEVEPAAKPTEPTAAPEAAPAAAPAVSTYEVTVKEGEDIAQIAIDNGVSPAEIRELNGIPDGTDVKVGQVIKIPAAQ